MVTQHQNEIQFFDLTGPNTYVQNDIFYIDVADKYKGFYEVLAASVTIDGRQYATDIDAALRATPPTIMNSPAFLTTAARMLTWGTYLISRGPKNLLNNVRRLTGRLYWALDTNELFAYNGKDWILVSANSGAGTEVYHDDSLEGKGIPSDLLKILEPIKDWTSRPPTGWQTGNAVHGTINGVPGIYKIEQVPTDIWQKTDVKYLNLNVQQTFQAGEYFYSDNPQVRNIYQVNHLISIFGLQDLLGHITSGEVTGLIDGAPYTDVTVQHKITKWVSGQTYYQLDRVYDVTNTSDYSAFYTCAVNQVTQTVFQAYTTHAAPVLLADIASGGSVGIPVGGTIGWFDNIPLPNNNWLRCDGSSVLKASYPALYAVIGGYFGQTATSFTLPMANNNIIRSL